jgi:hypothetical protein
VDFQRFLYDTLRERLLTDDRIVMILGSRQVGKTTLCQKLLSESGLRTKQFSGDEVRDADLWASGDLPRLASALAGYDLVLLDEAQRIPEVGLSLKLVHDAKLGPKYLVTGSSSLELAGQTREPLTGRTWTYQLFPIAVLELAQGTNAYELEPLVREALVLGSHPALYSLSNRDDKIAHLRELTDAYLYKDVLELTGIRNPRKLRDLLRLLAFQVGSEVSFQELGRSLGMAADSVISYIDLLEKAFVVYRLGAYSRNLRSEVTRNEKVYFYDNGVRNALIEDFKEIEQRNDQGALWENLLQAERRKTLAYSGQYGHSYFWRLHSGSELDLVEERDGRLEGYEFKWNPDKLPKAPRAWGEAYPNSSFAVINPRTYLPFLGVGSHSTREGNS